MLAALPPNETARLAALRDSRILDTSPEVAFDRIAALAARLFAMPMATISFVDRDRQWFKARVGLEACETSRTVSFCAHAILKDEVLVVPDATIDPRFADNDLVTGVQGIRFYAGAPLHAPDGQLLGTLCVLDYRPRRFGKRHQQILTDLAALVVDEMALRTEVTAREQAEMTLRGQHRVLQEVKDSIEKQVAVRTTELTDVNRALQLEIQQRKLADLECSRSEQRFRQLFNQGADAACVHDVEGRLLDVNTASYTLLGYSREELMALNVRDIVAHPLPAEGRSQWREMPAGSVAKFESANRRKDGSVFPVEVQVSALDTPQGRRLLAVARDISERKRSEELLRIRAREQEAVARLGSRALSGGSVEELLRETVAMVGDTLGIDMCRVYEYDAAQGTFSVAASLLMGNQIVGTRVADDRAGSLAGYVLRTAQPVIVEDVSTETRFEVPASLHAMGVKSALCVLIGGFKPGDPRFGLLGVGHRQRRAFSEDDVYFVQSVANVLAAAIARRRNEDKLRAVEARYQRIAANTPGVIYQYLLRGDGSVAVPFISESCRQLYGLEPHEIQRNPQLLLDCIHPEDLANFQEAMHTAKVQLTPLHWQGRHLLPDGEIRWMRADSRPERLPDGGTICDGIIIDITEQKRRNEALHQSEERFRLAILHSPFPVMLHANDGEIIKVNHAWTHMTGYLAEELATMEDWLVRAYPTEHQRQEVRDHLADMLNHVGAVEHPGQRILCADGDQRVWNFTCANLERLPDGRWLHITSAVDVTERDKAETALRAAKEEAERANRAKSVFLSRMSHELRTPLNAILGFGQLLELSPLGTQEAISLSYILKGGRHLLALIDEVLDLSRAETGDLHLTLGHVDLAALAQECMGLVARLAQARQITCQMTVPPKISLWVDEQRLRQMLLNLLSNAIKYNREGGSVFLSAEETPSGRLRLNVRDTGPGISEEGMNRLFVPFERLEQEFSEAEGTGLGLVISRRIAEVMGGTLGVESEVGRGSTFWIDLPLTASLEADQPVPVSRMPDSGALRTVSSAKLLYIEDNVSNLQVVKALLANCRPRWEFLSAQDGRSGLEQAHQHAPDLILLDLQLPGMKGDLVLAELRRDPRTQRIPVILLSADATAHSRERLLAKGADEYISKPFKLESLLELLDRTLLKLAVS